jgi:hypothetical protein
LASTLRHGGTSGPRASINSAWFRRQAGLDRGTAAGVLHRQVSDADAAGIDARPELMLHVKESQPTPPET